jgi:hypothetical protein
MNNSAYIDDEIKTCREFLKKILVREEIPVYPEISINCIDYIIAFHIMEANHNEWVTDDGSFGLQIGETPTRVLSEFAREERIFRGPSGTYKLMEYKRGNVSYFQAQPVIVPTKFSMIKEIYSQRKMN